VARHRVVRGTGGLPAQPGFAVRPHAALPAEEATSYLLGTSYHATLVFGMLAAALAGYDGVSRPPRPYPVAGRSVLDELGTARPRTWHRLLPETDIEPDAIAHLLLAIALRRRAHRLDLPGLRRWLELALELDLDDGPALRQAVRLLRRGAALAGHLPEACTASASSLATYAGQS
jgi:hypothetical protein